MDLEFTKTLYFRELDRRAQVDSGSSFRIGVLALLAGVFVYYLNTYTMSNFWCGAFFVLCATTSALFAFLAIISIIRVYVGFQWSYLPYPGQMLQYHQALQAYQAHYGESSPDAFSEYLLHALIESATANMINNNSRSEHLYAASRSLSIAVVSTMLAGIPVITENFLKILYNAG